MFQEAPLRRTSGQSRNSGATRASRKASASRFPPPAGASPSLACFGTKFSPATEETCEGLNLVTEAHENRLFRAIVAKKLALLKNKPMHSSIPTGSAISSCSLVGHSRDLRAGRYTRPLNCVICTNKAFFIFALFLYETTVFFSSDLEIDHDYQRKPQIKISREIFRCTDNDVLIARSKNS